ncbi:MAG: hypothetical protein ACP5SD_00245 [Elusimicrobiales bacterium]
MKCERCGENEAEVSVKTIINGRIKKMKMCINCAEKYAHIDEISKGKSSFEDYAEAIIEELPESKKKLICPKCHRSYLEFIKTQRLGCPFCYIKFGEILKKLVQFNLNETINEINYPYSIEDMEYSNEEKILKLKKKLKTYLDFEDIEMIKKTLLELKKLKEKK